jgi:hypothetical protein
MQFPFMLQVIPERRMSDLNESSVWLMFSVARAWSTRCVAAGGVSYTTTSRPGWCLARGFWGWDGVPFLFGLYSGPRGCVPATSCGRHALV